MGKQGGGEEGDRTFLFLLFFDVEKNKTNLLYYFCRHVLYILYPSPLLFCMLFILLLFILIIPRVHRRDGNPTRLPEMIGHKLLEVRGTETSVLNPQ
jgi:hypothetical protein